MHATSQKSRFENARQGATIVLMLFLLVIVFIFVAFAVDVGRIQLAQLKLQTSADLAARAGAEALSRGVGDTTNLADFEKRVRDETDMLMERNSLFGAAVAFDSNAQIQFGIASVVGEAVATSNGGGKGKGKRRGKKSVFSQNQNGRLLLDSNSISVNPDISQFPLMFGKFLGRDNVALSSRATAKVLERDIVVVVDRSGSMNDHDAGTIPLNQYPASLFDLEQQLYQPGDALFVDPNSNPVRHSEFEINNGVITLSKIQALKLALLRFRNVIDDTPGNERIGLTSYSDTANSSVGAVTTTANIDVDAGISPVVIQELISADPATATYAADLEDLTKGYNNFDYNYLGIRVNGNTNIVDGIEEGTEILFGANRRVIAKPIMLVLTDGSHNQIDPAQDAATPLIAAQNALAAHPEMLIYTITFGATADQAAMIEVANEGNGNHFHANQIDQLVEIFEVLASSAGVELIE